MISSVQVRDDPDEERFELVDDSEVVGFLDYRREGGSYWLTHTEIDEDRRGNGLGGRLVQGSLDELRRREATVVPTCPFVAGWVGKNSEYRDLVDWETWRKAKKR